LLSVAVAVAVTEEKEVLPSMTVLKVFFRT
jgi:hypothetical protein